MNIGIVGLGVVGKALAAYYEQGHTVFPCDKAYDSYDIALDVLNRMAEVVFICVGTPYLCEGKGLDCSAVHDAVDALTGSKTVIIKSTCMPGVTDAVQAKHPEHRVLFVPEFLSESTAKEDYAHPRRAHVVGYSCDVWSGYEGLLPKSIVTGVEYIPARQAELLKLATNAFYALKVTFANQLFDAGMEQMTLNALGSDPWIGGEHFEIEHKGYRGFGGACLPKDTTALVDYMDSFMLGVDDERFNILQAAIDYNELLRCKSSGD